MERFNVIFSGKMLEGHTPEKLPVILKLLKFSNEHIQHVRAGKPLTIKKNVNSKQALAIQKKFSDLGLKTQLQLVLNRRCLELGLNLVDKPLAAIDNTLVFNFSSLEAQHIRLPGTSEIYDSKGEPCGECQQFMLSTSTLVRLIFAVSISLLLQFYFLKIIPTTALGDLFPSNLAFILMGIVFLFIGVVFLPPAMQLLNIKTLRDQHGHTEGSIVNHLDIFPNASTHLLFDSADQLFARIRVKKNTVTCYSPSGQLLYEWRSNHNSSSNDITNDSATAKQDASAIRDSYGNTVAAVTMRNYGIKIFPQYRDAAFTLKAMAILAMERPPL